MTQATWMLPEAQHEDLLYVAQTYYGVNVVHVYAYKSRKAVGTLTSLTYPFGVCVDAIGDVWVTDYGANEVLEFAHGGTTPIKTLATDRYPVGCAVSPTGDLAVSAGGFTFSALDIFKNASGSATVYQNSACLNLGVPGYDANGNLYVEGDQSVSSYGRVVNVCELPAGGKSLKTVSFDRALGQGAVAWDGKHIAVSGVASGHTWVYQTREAPSGDLKAIGKTNLRDGECANGFDADSFIALVGKANTPVNHTLATAAVGGSSWTQCNTDFDGWRYPAGGDQKWSLSLFSTFGTAVSLAE